MDWLNLPGLTALAALLVPNILYAARHPNAKNLCQSRLLPVLEQVGRYGCMVLMCVRLPFLTYTQAAPAWNIVWLSLVTPLLFAYWVVWMAYFRRPGKGAALALAVVPALVFFVSGLLWLNVPLMLLSILFGVSHVLITRANVGPEA
jgi:hypothetical protein